MVCNCCQTGYFRTTIFNEAIQKTSNVCANCGHNKYRHNLWLGV